MKRTLLSVLLLLLTGMSAWAQSRTLEQLDKEIRQANTATKQLPLLVEAAQIAYQNGNSSGGRGYVSRAEKIMPRVSDPLALAEANHGLGSILRNNRKYRSAIPYFERAVKNLKAHLSRNPSRSTAAQLSKYYRDLGICYENIGNNTRMEKNLRYAAVYARQTAKDPQLASDAYLTLGEAYRRLEDYSNAEKSFEYALSEAKKAKNAKNVEEASRKLETIRALRRELIDRQKAQKEAVKLADDVVAKEEELDVIEDSLAKVEGDLFVTIEQKRLLELKVERTEAQVRAKRSELEAQEQAIKAVAAEAKAAKAETKVARVQRNQIISLSAAGGIIAVIIIIALLAQGRLRKRKNRQLANEKQRSDDLLLEILPANIADELKQSPNNRVQPVRHHHVTILFTDFKGFSSISERMDEEELVRELEFAFRGFDQIMEAYGMEKIKTIGDAYMAAAGLVKNDPFHAINAIAAGLEMQKFMARWNRKQRSEGKEIWQLRVGINSGEVVAGVVGSKKFAYDIWGKAVNLAARMESAGEPGKVNVSAFTHELTKEYVQFGPRRSAHVKNIGEVDMYFVEKIIARRKGAHQPTGARR